MKCRSHVTLPKNFFSVFHNQYLMNSTNSYFIFTPAKHAQLKLGLTE